MGMRTRLASLIAGLAAAILSAMPAHAAPPPSAVAPACDRACLTRAMDDYLAALVRHDVAGLPLNRDARFAENTHIARVSRRRCEVVDEQKGLVFAFPMFQHPGMRQPVRMVGVPGVDSLPLGRSSSNMQAGEIFKIVGGKIVSVEAMGAFLPHGMKSGWDE